VQAALEELQGDIDGISVSGDAANITVTPAGTIAATDVQAALEELDGDIQAIAAPAAADISDAGTAGIAVLQAETEADVRAAAGLTEVADTVNVFLPFAAAAGADITTGDGQSLFRVPVRMNGMNLTAVAQSVETAGTTGTQDVQIRRIRAGSSADMLTVKSTLASGKYDSGESGNTAATIDTSNDDVATGDLICTDVDAVQSTPAKGVGGMSLTFTKP
jgi:hypothetical protein